MKKLLLFALAACLIVPAALAVNEGATVTAPFLATPPTIDGVVSDGEWDDAAVPPGDWSDHGSATLAGDETTVVKVAYSVDGLYILFQCVDPEVLAGNGSEYLGSGPTAVDGQAQPFTFSGPTDYLAIYVDPSNYPDDGLNSSFFSYSIQAEPAVTAWDEDASYTYTEAGQNGRFKRKFDPPLVDNDGVTHYWAGGISWELNKSKIIDGPTADGYVMEWFVAWTDLDGYYMNWASEVLDGIADVALDETDPFNSENGLVHAFFLDADSGAGIGGTGFGNATGMPLPGTEWKIQFSRYSQTAVPSYTNWVGDTGGFVTRPFGTLIFGDASGSAVRDALMHVSNN
ncbi:hypothetical protein K8I31_08395 [bacterium]|nr:hypothetical protein [bacterium]